MTGSNTNCKISSCTVKIPITGGSYVGGILGYLYGGSGSSDNYWYANVSTIQSCVFNGTITATGSYVGGVVGFGYNGRVTQSDNNNSTISVSSTSDYVGGIIGWAENVHVDNCNNYVSISGRDYVGGIVGRKRQGKSA